MGDSVLVRAVFKFKGTNNDEVKRKEMGENVNDKLLKFWDWKTFQLWIRPKGKTLSIVMMEESYLQ